jgi:hypothetical protein
VLARAHPVNHGQGDIHFIFAWVGPALLVPWVRPAWLARKRWRVPLAFGLLAAIDAVLSAGLANTLAATGDGPKNKWANVNRRHRSEIDLLRLDGAKRTLRPWGGDRDNSHLLTRDAALYGYSGLRNNLQEAWILQPILVASATSENRFWFSPETIRSSPCVDAYNLFLQRTLTLGGPPLVIHDRSSMLNSTPCKPDELERVSHASAAVRIPVAIERYEPDALTLRFEAPQDGWLLVTDRWAAGWVVKVNGSPAAVEGGNFLFRALHVRSGSNRVALTYEPPGHPWLPVLVWVFIAAVLAVSWWRPFRSRREIADVQG